MGTFRNDSQSFVRFHFKRCETIFRVPDSWKREEPGLWIWIM
ncbi:11038_t:CDS:2 [Rhizophagus irregularis]|nr:11038_t:CDS:2 [Rhizophagus irregularis]